MLGLDQFRDRQHEVPSRTNAKYNQYQQQQTGATSEEESGELCTVYGTT